MVLQLNPDIPLVWRTPSSLQFGVESPVVLLENVSTAQEHIIAALAAGVTEPGVKLIAQSVHASEGELAGLLGALEPLLRKPPAAPSGRVAVIGTAATAARLRTAAAEAGLELVAPDDPVDLGILVSHYVVEPQLFGYWLSRDIPHLPIVVTDTGAHVGPVVEPGLGPCLYCVELHRTDADPARPAIASQLWGRSSPAETPLLITDAVSLALRMALHRFAAGVDAVAASVFLDAATGEATRREWTRHPDCGCAALPENGSGTDRATGTGLSPTTTAEDASAPS